MAAALLLILAPAAQAATRPAQVSLAPSGTLRYDASGGTAARTVDARVSDTGTDVVIRDQGATATSTTDACTASGPLTVCHVSDLQRVQLTLGPGSDTYTFHGPAAVAVSDWVDAGAGNDTLTSSSYESSLDGGAGTDVISGNGLNDNGFSGLFGGPGNDRVSATGYHAMLDGGDGADRLTGTAQYDTLLGDAGPDVLIGGLDNDFLIGGDGNDVLDGGENNDELEGGAGADTLKGGPGVDTAEYNADFPARTTAVSVTLDGLANDGAPGEGDRDVSVENVNGTRHEASGADLLTGNAGANQLFSGTDGAVLAGLGGNDYITSATGSHHARLLGGDGGDQLFLTDGTAEGGAGADNITAESAFTVVEAGAGTVAVDAGPGDDVINSSLEAFGVPHRADPQPDDVACGDGDDSVTADAEDAVAADCEHVRRV